MTRLTALLSLLLVCAPFAQIVKSFSVPTASSCEINVSGGIDIDSPAHFGTGNFFAFKDGCKAKIFDIAQQKVAYQLDLDAVGADTKSSLSYVTFYNNLTTAGGWAAVYTSMYYDTTAKKYNYTVGVIDGNRLNVLSKTATSNASFYSDGKALYLAVPESDRTDFYMLRSGMTQKAAHSLIPVGGDHPQYGRIWYEYDPAGRSLNDGNTPRNVKMLRR